MEKVEKLRLAVETESVVDVRILLEQGADALACGSSGMNAVGCAASIGNVNILARLLKSCQDDQRQPASVVPGDAWMEVDSVTTEEISDLEWDEEIDSQKVFSPDREWLDLYSYYARMWENIGQVLDTASELKDVHCLDRHQLAPLHYAAKFGRLSCVRLLYSEYKCPVDIQTYSGQTALHLACEYQHHRVVKFLLQSGSSVNLKTFKVEDTALLKAAKNGNNRIVEMLLDHGASINTCNAYDVSALIGATFLGHCDTVKCLVKHGANVNLKDRDGLTALVIAVHNEATETIRCLLANNARLIPSHNLVHTAINLGNDEILRMLILAGEQVTRGKDSYGLLPIDKIIQRGNLEMLHFCYEYFGLQQDKTFDRSRELVMAMHCEDVGRFRQLLRYFLTLGRRIDGEEVIPMGIKMRRLEHVKVLLQENVQVDTEFNEEVLEMLQKDTKENGQLLVYLVSAGFPIHRLTSIRNKCTNTTGRVSAVTQYLQHAHTNPLSLQDLTRIRIRSILRETMRKREELTSSCDPTVNPMHEKTPLERALISCGLPPRLTRFIYEFTDLESNCTSPMTYSFLS